MEQRTHAIFHWATGTVQQVHSTLEGERHLLKALLEIHGWPRVLLIAASLGLIAISLAFDLRAIFGPEDQVRFEGIMLGS